MALVMALCLADELAVKGVKFRLMEVGQEAASHQRYFSIGQVEQLDCISDKFVVAHGNMSRDINSNGILNK